MTNSEYQAWLDDHAAVRVVLAELEHANGTEYVATHPYISRPSDSDANRIYDDLLAEAIDIETRIDALLTFGRVQLINDGELDAWLDYAWAGHEIRLYLGGPDWSRDDFRLHARGLNNGITSARRGELTFEMLDQSAKLDEPIDTGTLPLDGGPVPLALGDVYNAPAFRVSTSSLTYRASYLPANSLSPKALGNGVPHSENLSAGEFTLNNAPGGALTVDIKETHSTVDIPQWVAAQYGITVAENSLPDYSVGMYYSDVVTGRQILTDLCLGMGAYWYLNAVGELIIRQHLAPSSPDLTLYADDIEDDTLELIETQAPWSSLTIRWKRNHSPLSEVAGTIEDNNATEAERLKREWSESTATQSLPDYPQAEEVVRDSPFAYPNATTIERDRLLALRAVRRDIWRMDAFLPEAEVGQAVAVEFGPLAGRVGRIIAVRRAPTRGTTTLEVWV